VAGAIENDDHEIFDVAVETFGDGAKVIGHGRIEIDGAFAGGANNDFLHVQVRSMQQAAFFAGGKNDDGIGRAGGAEIGALERVHGDINHGEKSFGA